MLALLTELMTVPSATVASNIENRPGPKSRDHLFNYRPRPYYNFPYCAKVSTCDRSPLPEELSTVRLLFEYFKSFSPCAAGRRPSTNINLIAHSKGFLCFEREDLLLKFIQSVEFTLVGGKLLAVKVIEAPSPLLEREKISGASRKAGGEIKDNLELGLAGGLDALFLS